MDWLLIIAAVWLAAASFTDLKKREVADWLSFSLIAIALAFRAAESVITSDLNPLTTSLIGLAAFFILANMLYYGKVFAGGDAKILMALGAVIPGLPILANLIIVGGLYGIVYSLFLGIYNLKEVYQEIRKRSQGKSHPLLIFFIALLAAAFSTNSLILYAISTALISLYLLQIFVNSVEKSVLIRKVKPKDLTEGDWLLQDLKINNKTIKATFNGLTKNEISLIKKAGKEVYIKYGIPFIPAFLIALLLTINFGNIFLFILGF